MGRLRRWLFRGKPRHSEEEVEALRRDFKDRYMSFKLLLDANHKALEFMAQVDARLRGTRPFGMTWVRGISARIATHVWQMVRRLKELAPERYGGLRARFRAIQEQVAEVTAHRPDPQDGALVLGLDDITLASADLVGGKLSSLGEIRNRVGLRVPDGFVVTTRGLARFLEAAELREEVDRRLQIASAERPDELHRVCGEIEVLITTADVPEDLAAEILAHYRELEVPHGEGVCLAVRSSALQEDEAGASFAGQYRTVLNVRADSLLEAYREVVASQYGAAAMIYRRERGIPDADGAMCVGFLVMVDAEAGGVAYSRNPVDVRDDSVYVQSAWGLGTGVVDGRNSADLFVVKRGDPPEIVKRDTPVQGVKFVRAEGGGVDRLDLAAEEGAPASISDATVLELASVAQRLEVHYGAPQDIEWAVEEDGGVVLLQSRTLVQLETADREVGGEPAGPVLAEGGITASPGVAAGTAFVVRQASDALAFPDDAILVADQALPEWAPLLPRAAALVTGQGTIAGHLASVARELRLPALLGIEGALTFIRNAEEITVDADGRRVYAGRINALLQSEGPRRNLMAGSRVMAALEEFSGLVTRLTLLDPNSAHFTPTNCETLHDLTRFCHEKAVAEMFRFGRDHDFPERSSKQLHCEVPMQWWVLNLDDGFAIEVPGKYVHLDNIVSIPMRALWDGIVAVPWAGPPPIDGKGFMAVMFEATRNPALAPGRRSDYTERNYFLVSKNYCSLSTRLGAHFSIVEAMVGERVRENYVSFQFKGGAADYERRLKRVKLIADLLEEFGFRVSVHEDNLTGRVEGYDAAHMESRLRILGYLTIHTRQLDMIMSRPALVEGYRKKLREDLAAVLADT